MDKYVGKKFGRLTVYGWFNRDWIFYFQCQCDCGQKKDIHKQSILSGRTLSCGCLHKELASKRMKKQNPMKNAKSRLKMKTTLLEIRFKPKIVGGNGRIIPHPEQILFNALGIGWYSGYVFRTRMRRGSGYPTNYKIDIANPLLKIGIEIDGRSHNSFERRMQDKKKEEFLLKRGWKIIRYKNEQVLSSLEDIIKELNGIIASSKRNTR